MQRKIVFVAVPAGALIIGILLGRLFFGGNDDGHAEHDHATASGSALLTEKKAEIWTCSMHPQIQQPDPGKCPICGMDLIELVDNSGADDGPRTLSMSESSRALAAIETTEVRREFPVATIRLVGKLDYDETRMKSLTARFPARVDELFVNYTGVGIEAGEHLARVYSPELLSAQRELITSHRIDPNSSITRAAREKLRLWDLLPDQIDEILKQGEPQDDFELRSPIGGVVVAKNINEGDYVETGEPLFRIVDLSRLWLHLEAYESDLAWLRYGQDVSFTVESFPGETFTGRIAFIAPEVDRKTRTIAARVNVANSDGRLKPGMFARGQVQVRLADAGKVYMSKFAGKWISPMHPEIVKDEPGQCDVCGMDLVPAEQLGFVDSMSTEPPLIVPTSAVLRTGKRAVVYVENPESDRPSFEGREIVLGLRAGDNFIVKSGLEAGERVVSHGAFKIDSSLQILAKPSMMNPSGGGPVPGHNHGGANPPDAAADPHAGHNHPGEIEISRDELPTFIQSYLEMQAALASDDLDAAKTAAKSMMSYTGHDGALPDLLHAMLGDDSLANFRASHFGKLSQAFVAAAQAMPGALDHDMLVMHCPMAQDGAGADWLQAQEPLRNPYFGAMMLTCGEVTESIPSTAAETPNHAH